MVESLTVIYDNRAIANLKSDWGFSVLIEGNTTLLFDTGAKPRIFKENAEKLNIDISEIEIVFISHNHWDHTGSIKEITNTSKNTEVFVPKGDTEYIEEKIGKNSTIIPVITPTVISPEIITTGIMETGVKNPAFEQALILNTKKGYILLTGCAHPGILEITEKATNITGNKLFMILGGFHLYKTKKSEIEKITDKIKNLTDYVAPCHCTGEKGLEVFKKIFKDKFIDCMAGTEITF